MIARDARRSISRGPAGRLLRDGQPGMRHQLPRRHRDSRRIVDHRCRPVRGHQSRAHRCRRASRAGCSRDTAEYVPIARLLAEPQLAVGSTLDAATPDTLHVMRELHDAMLSATEGDAAAGKRDLCPQAARTVPGARSVGAAPAAPLGRVRARVLAHLACHARRPEAPRGARRAVRAGCAHGGSQSMCTRCGNCTFLPRLRRLLTDRFAR